MVHVIAMEVLPEERDRKYYADNYSCCPPPLFVIFVTLVEVSRVFTLIFLYLAILHKKIYFYDKSRWNNLKNNSPVFNSLPRHNNNINFTQLQKFNERWDETYIFEIHTDCQYDNKWKDLKGGYLFFIRNMKVLHHITGWQFKEFMWWISIITNDGKNFL